MSDTVKANQGAVSSLADTDLVMCCVNGAYHPIMVSHLTDVLKYVGDAFRVTELPAVVTAGSWIRIARSIGNQFSGIISVDTNYKGNTPPHAAFIALGGYNASWGDLWAEHVNTKSMISAVRFIKDGTTCYIEVKFNSDKADVFYVTLGNSRSIALIPASVSTEE